MISLWSGFIAMIVALVLLDLFVLSRGRPRPTPASGLLRALIYLLAAVTFNAALYLGYANHWHGLGLDADGAVTITAGEASLQFLTSLCLEIALDVDSVFAFSAIFLHFRTPDRSQHRVLLWGILLALAIRGGMIGGFGWLLHSFGWAKLVLSFLLVLAAMRMLLIRRENVDPEKNPLLRLLRFLFPVAANPTDDNLVSVVNGRMALTPLLITLILLETADGLFAFDSIPAIFAVGRDSFIVFAANAFGLLCLRSLYFALADLTGWIRYVKIGLAMILAYVAVVMSLPRDHAMPTSVSLIVIGGTLLGAVIVAVLFRRPGPTPMTSPLGVDAERIARLTLQQTRKLIILVVGVSITIVGILMLIGPGPGLLVIPIGLALLASEFVWARYLLNRYKVHAEKATRKAGNVLVKTPRPELVAPIICVAVIAFILVLILCPWPARYVVAVAIPVFVFVGIWAYTTIVKHRELIASRDFSQPPRPPDQSDRSAA